MSKIQGLISEIKNLSALEMLELVDSLQNEFGVSASSFAPASQTASVVAAAPEVKTNFSVVLTTVPTTEKTKVIKALRTIRKDLGLMEAKAATENLPFTVFTEANKEDMENAKKVLEEAGAQIKVS